MSDYVGIWAVIRIVVSLLMLAVRAHESGEKGVDRHVIGRAVTRSWQARQGFLEFCAEQGWLDASNLEGEPDAVSDEQ